MHLFKLLFFILSILLVACQDEQTDQTATVTRPVKTILVDASESGGLRHFPGLLDASQKADISFRVRGKLHKVLVKEGEDVKKDQLLAELDPTDFQIVVNDKQAAFTRANADFRRAKELIKKGHISRMDYDRLEADYKSRLADLNKAKRDLGYTKLKAPFDGTIAQRSVENYEEILASQVVFALRNNDLLEVKINVPENIVLRIKPRKNNSDAPKIPVWASFENVPGQQFPLLVKEVAAKADTKTQTFLVTFTMPAPEGITVLPGMTANVSADLSKHLAGAEVEVYSLPISAVTGDAKLQSRVWVVDEATLTVRPKAVVLGEMKGSQIEILEGINGGERVVTAGAGYMAEGMKVTLIPEHEQATPRPDDVRLSNGL